MGKKDIPEGVNTSEDSSSSSSFSSVVDDVCKELDQLLLRKLELIQEYVDLSLSAQVHQKDGYLHLAKSRYSDGGSHSTTRVRVVESEAVATMVPSSSDNEGGDDVDEVGALMKSKLVFADEDSLSQKSNSLLKQFGLLPSSSVRNAQKSFRHSLALYVDKNNVFRELSMVEKRFSELQRKKMDLLNHELKFKSEP